MYYAGSTMRLIFNLYSTFNALLNIQLPIQHSTIHFIFNSFFTHSITVYIQQFQSFIQHSTLIFKTFNYSLNIQLFIQLFWALTTSGQWHRSLLLKNMAAAAAAVLCSPLWLMFVFYVLWGRRSFIDPKCRNFCMVLSMCIRLVLANYLFCLRDIILTLGLLTPRRHVVWRDSVDVEGSRSELKSECADILHQSFLVITPYWRAPTRAKQLSMATIPLCFEFFRCRVDVLQS